MSLILEALRKSEAERRRGQTPDLLTEVAPVTSSTRATTQDRRTWVVLAVAAVITVLLVLWWLRPQAEPSTQAVMTDARVAPASAPSPSAVAATLPPLRPPVAAPRRASTSPAATASTSAESIRAPVPASLPSSALPPPPPASEPVTPAPTATAKLPEPSAAISVFSSPDVPVRLADLSSEDRQQLPALKLSMHMWAPAVADRFVIIDGTRVNEGDRVGDAVVEAIQTDGVLLSWRGRRIRLPIR